MTFGRHFSTYEAPYPHWKVDGEWFYVWRRSPDGRMAYGGSFLTAEAGEVRMMRAMAWQDARRAVKLFIESNREAA